MRLLALLLLFALPAEAGPLAWVKRHPIAAKLIYAGAAAGVYAEGLHQCRIPNVENCQAHYGAAWGTYGATVGLDLVGQLVGQKIGGKTGNAIAYGGSTAMLGWGIWQWHGGLNNPKEDSDAKIHPDLRSVVIIRR